MIQLSDTVRAGFAYLASPPTHAQCIYLRHAAVPEGLALSGSIMTGIPNHQHVEAVYAYGSVDESGAFIPNAHVAPVQVLVDPKDYSVEDAPADDAPSAILDAHAIKLQKSAAFKNLIGAGVTPTPGAPHEATDHPAALKDEFSRAELNAVVSFFYPELSGTVV